MSTYCYVSERLHPGRLEQLARGGAEAIEIFAARGHFDYGDRAQVREMANWFSTSGVHLHSLHSPMFTDYEWGRTGAPPINIVDQEKRRRIEAMDEIKRALETAEQLHFRFLVQHVGIGGEEFQARKFEDAMTAVEHLRAFARPLGVSLLLENIPNELSQPEKLAELIRTLRLDGLGICFDVGHAHLGGGVATAFETLKAYIRSTHVHDNAGDRDAHLWPGEGSIDWNEVMGLLRSAPQVPPVLLEIEGEADKDMAAGMSAAFRKLEAAASVPQGSRS